MSRARGRARQKQAAVTQIERKIVGIEDLVLLRKIDNESLVANLNKRFKADEIYTYIGNVLVVCNPFKWIRIYEPEHIKMHDGANKADLAPHIFAIAEEAFRTMVSEEDKQCVIISGESGAGKTEAAKGIMNYIAAVSGSGGNDRAVTALKNIVLDSNPVLEAFGNAMTLRNNNSSRFGKYFQLQFDLAAGGTPRGGLITNYLLEKSRVVRPGQGERSFHIFYQLLAGANSQLRSQYALSTPEHYQSLAMSGVYQINNDGGRTDDAKEFQETLHSMETVGIDAEEQSSFFSVVASVLHLSNITFQAASIKNADGSAVRDKQAVQNAAAVMGVDANALEYTITNRTLTTMAAGGGVETYQVPNNPIQAQSARDALCKDLYFRLFDLLVARINIALAQTGASTRSSVRMATRGLTSEDLEESLSIGVLDIYGFEIFEKNLFEQFCINYVNEKLQNIFIELTLKTEQEDYASEGIQWTPIPYFDNKVVCELIEGKRPPGVFAILDDTVKSMHAGGGKDIDGKFLEKLASNVGSHQHFSKFRGGFQILHYAGNVQYSVEGFVETNKDTLSQDMVHLCKSSANDFLAELFPEEVNMDQRRQPPTAGHKIKTQCGDLVYTLMDCTPHYVRCIKSNDSKKAGVFDEQRVSHQSRYLGLLENVKVRRAGFAFRTDFFRFTGRYKVLGAGLMDPNVLANGNDHDICAHLVQIASQRVPDLRRSGEVQMGKSKIFIKTPETLDTLQEQRKAMVSHQAVKIQTVFRRFMARRDLVFLRVEMSELWEKHGKDPTPGDLLRPYLANYLNDEEMKLSLAEVLDWYQSSEIHQERIMYSDVIERLVSNKKWEKVTICITDKAIYLLEWKSVPPSAAEQAKAKKEKRKLKPIRRLDLLRRTLLKHCQAIYLSHMADDLMHLVVTPDAKKKPDKSGWVKASKVARCMETQEKFSRFGKKRYQCSQTGNVYIKDVMTKMALPDLGFYSPVDVHQSAEGMVSVEAREDQVFRTEKKAELVAMLRDLCTRAKGGKTERKGPVAKAGGGGQTQGKPRAKAMYAYQAAAEDEISFKEGDTFELLDTSNPDWWMGHHNGKNGVFPAAYVQKIASVVAAAPKRANPTRGYLLKIEFADSWNINAAKFLSKTFSGKVEFVKNPSSRDIKYKPGAKFLVQVPPGVAGQKVRAIQQSQAARAAKREEERNRLFAARQQNARVREAERARQREAKLEAKKAKKRAEREKRSKADQNRNFAAKNAQAGGASFAARLAGKSHTQSTAPAWMADKDKAQAAQAAAPPWVVAQQSSSGATPEKRRDANWRQNVRSVAIQKSATGAKPPPPPKKKVQVVWERYKDDDSGDFYFYNLQTGATQWEAPKCKKEEIVDKF